MTADLRWKLDDWHAHSGSRLDLEELRRSFEDMVEAVEYKDTIELEATVEDLQNEVSELESKLEDVELEYATLQNTENEEIQLAEKNLEASLDRIAELEEELRNMAEKESDGNL